MKGAACAARAAEHVAAAWHDWRAVACVDHARAWPTRCNALRASRACACHCPACSFFGERQQADYARLASAAGISLREKPLVIGHGGRGPALAYRGEGGRYAPPTEPLAGSSDDDEEQEEVEEDEEALEGSMEVRGLVTCCANRGCL